MSQSIALGFQNTVDFELEWNPGVVESMIREYDIRQKHIRPIQHLSTERDILIVLLYYMANGIGAEHITDSSRITRVFASRFHYKVTLGGTAVRAAIALSMIGYPSIVHACSNNHYFRELLPKNVAYRSSVPDEGEDFNPHVIVQFPVGATVRANDISIVCHRPNRVIFAYDPPSVVLVIDPDFGHDVRDAGVFVAASFNAIKKEDIARKRLSTAVEIIRQLPADCTILMEDGCFEHPAIRAIVTEVIASHLRIFSMNEDELQDRFGRRIDILNPHAVAEAVTAVAEQIHVPCLICHSAFWALAFGSNPLARKDALQGGIDMASTRFRCGDRFSLEDYRKTSRLRRCTEGVDFSAKITRILGADRVCCIAGWDLQFVSAPTTIGLGDAFIGGMLPRLLPERCL